MGGIGEAVAPAMPRALAAAPAKPTEGLMLSTKVVTWALATFAAITYVVCIVYGLVVPENLHMSAFLEQVLPGFRWLTPLGLVVGLVESFLYGAYAGLVFTPIHNAFWRRWGAGGGRGE